MTLKQFKEATPKQLNEYGKTIPLGETYDKNGKLVTYKNSYGY
ncbi:hypothetical protein AB0R99_00110 [Erwinia amylovora]